MRSANTIFNSSTKASRLVLVALAAAALGGTLAGTGCAGKHAKDATIVPDRDRAAELAQAQRFQEQAFNAQKDEEYDRAISLYSQALQIDSSLGAAWHNVGICFMKQKRYLDAQRAFIKAADAMPSDPRPYESLGVLFIDQGFAKQSYEWYGRALERDPYSLAALRGSTRAIKLLRLVSTDAQSRLQRGLEVESNKEWRTIMTTERIRVEAGLREEARR